MDILLSTFFAIASSKETVSNMNRGTSLCATGFGSEKHSLLRDALHACLPKLYSSEPLWLLRRALAAPVSMCPCYSQSCQRLQFASRR